MTAEREAMTERQAFEKWVLDSREVPANFNRTPSGYFDWVTESVWAAWQAAIAHLSRAAEPVYQARATDDSWWDVSEELYVATSATGRRILYTHPPEPARDAKDAARYRWLRDRMYRFEIEAGVLDSKAFAERPRIGYGREVDSAIDNAMTKENGNG